MDINRFDQFTRNYAAPSSRRSVIVLVATFNLTGIGRHHARAAQKKKKFTLCFQNEAIAVSKKAKKRYLAQGATTGACPTTPPSPPPPPCVGNCAGKVCGDDGCGRQCAPCQVGLVCEANRCCFPCVNGACCPDNLLCYDNGDGVFYCSF
jgi:hypothetical protein